MASRRLGCNPHRETPIHILPGRFSKPPLPPLASLCQSARDRKCSPHRDRREEISSSGSERLLRPPPPLPAASQNPAAPRALPCRAEWQSRRATARPRFRARSQSPCGAPRHRADSLPSSRVPPLPAPVRAPPTFPPCARDRRRPPEARGQRGFRKPALVGVRVWWMSSSLSNRNQFGLGAWRRNRQSVFSQHIQVKLNRLLNQRAHVCSGASGCNHTGQIGNVGSPSRF